MIGVSWIPQGVTDAVLDAWAVLMPTECSGCGAPDRAVCDRCRAALRGQARASSRDDLVVWSAVDYASTAARMLVSYKDGGRLDAAPALAAALRTAVLAACAATGERDIQLVTIPSSAAAWRTRGFRPVDRLLRRAGLRPVSILRPLGGITDQVGLGREARLDNRRDSLTAVRMLSGRRFVLVDDIVTTGATLLEARRAIRAAGGEVLCAATVAETRRRHSVIERSGETG